MKTTPGNGVVTHEMFMRYVKDKRAYQFKLNEDAEPVEIAESAIPNLVASITEPRQKEVLSFLVDAAKKDSEGKWVSASDKPVGDGQAVIGGAKR